MGHCRGLPPPPNHTPGEGGSGEEGRGGENGVGKGDGPDPAREILATIGADNAGKYVVASQVQAVIDACAFSVYLVCPMWVLSFVSRLENFRRCGAGACFLFHLFSRSVVPQSSK